MSDTIDNNNNNNNTNASRNLPTVVTAVQGGWALLQPTEHEDQPYVNTLRRYVNPHIVVFDLSHRFPKLRQELSQKRKKKVMLPKKKRVTIFFYLTL